MLAALALGDFVTLRIEQCPYCQQRYLGSQNSERKESRMKNEVVELRTNSHVVRQLLEVNLLLGELLLEFHELLLLALANGVVLAGLFALLEGVAVWL